MCTFQHGSRVSRGSRFSNIQICTLQRHNFPLHWLCKFSSLLNRLGRDFLSGSLQIPSCMEHRTAQHRSKCTRHSSERKLHRCLSSLSQIQLDIAPNRIFQIHCLCIVGACSLRRTTRTHLNSGRMVRCKQCKSGPVLRLSMSCSWSFLQ